METWAPIHYLGVKTPVGRKRFSIINPVVAMVAFNLVSCSPQHPDEPDPRSFPEPVDLRSATERENDLFHALDLDFPGLEKVKASIAAADFDAAIRELAAYYRTRTVPVWRARPGYAPNPEFQTGAADAVVDGRLVGGLVDVEHSFAAGDVDWFFNPTKDVPGRPFNPEWQWQLNRMAFWQDLADAYRATGDEKYARAFTAQMLDWVADCPVPDVRDRGSSEPSAWRTIEAGIRMGGVWPDTFSTFLPSPSFSDGALVTMLGSFLDHARYLRKFPSAANWLTMEMSGLYTVGALFPEFKEASDWRNFAASTLAAEVEVQFLPDGGHVELTPGYHLVALDNMLAIIDTARTTGFESELPTGYLTAMERAYSYLLALHTPDANLPRPNDSWPVPARDIFTKAVRFFPDRPDFLWAMTAGQEGIEPPFTSTFLDWSGYAVMRSGWGPMENYLMFDVGPLGFGHVHQDKLNVVLWAWGREILFDSGGGSYERGSKFREWSISTASHNCVLVDGLNQNVPWASDPQKRYKDPSLVSQTPIDAGWVSTPVIDYAQGTYDQGFGPARMKIARHERRVLFLKPDIFVVADELVPNDDFEHTYEARWHLLTTRTQTDPATDAVVTADAGLANLAIIPLKREGLSVKTASAQEEPEILGWNHRKDMTPQLLPATTVIHLRKGEGKQQFLTLLLPLRPGENNPVSSVIAGDPAIVTLADKREFTISTNDGITIAERLPDGSAGRSWAGPARQSSSPEP
jgi:hypothetical protein